MTDGTHYEKPVARTAPDLASAARTASANGTAFNTEDIDEIHADLTITAVAGTNPTLDVRLETKTKTDADWYTAGTIPQQTAATPGGNPVGRVFGDLGDQCRWAWTIGGTDTPSFTFSIASDASVE